MQFGELIQNLHESPNLKLILNTAETYTAWQKAKEDNADEKTLSEKEEALLESYRQQEFYKKIEMKREFAVYREILREQEKLLDKKIDKSEPEDFLDAMGYVIGANQKAALKRLGGILNVIPLLYKYGNIF